MERAPARVIRGKSKRVTRLRLAAEPVVFVAWITGVLSREEESLTGK